MKFLKIFSVLALSAMTINMSAALNAKAQLVFSSDEATTNYLISQDDAVANDFTSTNCGKVTTSPDAYALYAYTEYNSQNYAAVELNDIHGVVVKFKANPYETSYTLTISNVEGGVKVFKEGVEVASPYTFTCAASEVVEFTIKMHDDVYTRTVSNVWGTICLPQSVDAANITNATIYSVASKTETNLYLEEVTTGMVAGTPYIFKADAAGDVKFAYNNDAVLAPVAATGLVGTFVDTYIGVEEMYVISNNVVRLATASSSVKANRAYINLNGVAPYAPAPGRKLVPVRIANATTDIENAAEAAEIEKQIVNGQLLIRKAGVLYNVQGQIVK